MSAKHTPGPWEVGPNSIGEASLIAAHGRFVVAYAAWNGGSGCELSIKNPADAALIAAAPDLLDTAVPALVELDVVIGLLTSERTRAEMQVVADNLRAAIAKATGA